MVDLCKCLSNLIFFFPIQFFSTKTAKRGRNAPHRQTHAPILYVQRLTVQQPRQVKQNANVVQLHAVVSLTVVGVKPLQYLSNLIFFYPIKTI